jgi:signal transduction histidine kinase
MAWALLVFGLACISCAAWRYAQLRPAAGRVGGDLDLGLLLMVASAACACLEFALERPSWFRAALAVRAFTFLLLIAFVAGSREIELVLLCGILVEVAAYEPFPRNAALGASIFACAVLARLGVFIAGLRQDPFDALRGQADFLLVGASAFVPALLFTRYRERVIGLQEEKDRLDETVVRLAKANMQYQSSAAEASEAGMRDERLRITREIHDVVGYTLTNNIAMMEAATDMIRRNPLGVPALINAARDNASEGLQQVRAALYQLRAQGEPPPAGLRALTRLCRLFAKATRIEVTFSCGNARWRYGERIDSVLHHLVQEALLNAFRHGKPAHATVALSEDARVLTVSVTDDGAGTASFSEGIGLRGMRERVEEASGRLEITSRPGLFSVLARIPLEEDGRGG